MPDGWLGHHLPVHVARHQNLWQGGLYHGHLPILHNAGANDRWAATSWSSQSTEMTVAFANRILLRFTVRIPIFDFLKCASFTCHTFLFIYHNVFDMQYVQTEDPSFYRVFISCSYRSGVPSGTCTSGELPSNRSSTPCPSAAVDSSHLGLTTTLITRSVQ